MQTSPPPTRVCRPGPPAGAATRSRGRAIARKGQREPLNKGEVAAVKAVDRAIAELGQDHPIVKECLDTLLRIARGEISGRYVGDRYRAIVQLLDRVEGKPTEKREHTGKVEHVVRVHRD